MPAFSSKCVQLVSIAVTYFKGLDNKLLRLIRFLWNLFMTVVLLSLLSLGLAFFFARQNLSPLVERLETLITQKVPTDLLNTTQITLPKIKNQKQGETQTDTQSQTTARWNENNATVYLEATDDRLRTAYLTAIKNWNQTGAFDFKLVDDQSKAQIRLKQHDDASTNAAGVTHTVINQLTNRLESADVYLNEHYLLDPTFGYSQERIDHTAEHELGHAIGLAHDDENVSVMQSAGSFYTIQPKDVAAVKQLYQS